MMRCCECEFRSQCDESETVLTAFVRCYKRDRLLDEKKAKTKAGRIQAMPDKEKELTTQLRRMSVETGSLMCLGCGYEHNCGIHGCALLRQAAETIERQAAIIENKAYISRSALLEDEEEPAIWHDTPEEVAERNEWLRWTEKIKNAPSIAALIDLHDHDCSGLVEE